MNNSKSLFCFAIILTTSLFSSIDVASAEDKGSNPFQGRASKLGNLATVQPFASEELQAFRDTGRHPRTDQPDADSDRLQSILNNFDVAQPTKLFPESKGMMRFASFNITRGYTLEALKLIWQSNPAMEELLEAFPEVSNTMDIAGALEAIEKASADSKTFLIRKEQFYALARKLGDPDQSTLPRILCSAVDYDRVPRNYPKCLQMLNPANAPDSYSYADASFRLAKEVFELSKSDVIALQEVDWGMPRTNYNHVVREIAKATGMGYAYGVEFIELTDEGVPYKDIKDGVDEERFKGYHGNAILSKWPLKNVRLLRFAESLDADPSHTISKNRRCYDWWIEELPKTGPFEKAVGKFSHLVFDETVIPSVRLGSRMAMIADVQTPRGMITAVSTHLENRGNASCRRAELEDILHELKTGGSSPTVIIGGDFNTTNEEARRPIFVHAVYWYLRNQMELSTLASSVATSLATGLIGVPPFLPIPTSSIVQHINQMREWRNPPGAGTAERKMFRESIGRFRFEDGQGFDMRGTPGNNYEGSTRLLANSNQSTNVGYKPSFCFKRNFGKQFCMRLDWILVKSPYSKASMPVKSNDWGPSNPHTLFDFVTVGGISNHAAITSDISWPSIQPPPPLELSQKPSTPKGIQTSYRSVHGEILPLEAYAVAESNN